jgi:hypothetical protein
VIAVQGEWIAELERRLGQDSSRPPLSDALWDKKRSVRGRSGRKPGMQPGVPSNRSAAGDVSHRWPGTRGETTSTMVACSPSTRVCWSVGLRSSERSRAGGLRYLACCRPKSSYLSQWRGNVSRAREKSGELNVPMIQTLSAQPEQWPLTCL